MKVTCFYFLNIYINVVASDAYTYVLVIFEWFTSAEEDLDCEKPEDIVTDIYEDNEARVFHDKGIPFSNRITL